jgi:hypothetical protein
LIRKRVVLSLLLAALFTLGWFVGRSRATGDLYGNLDLFVEIIHKVEANYVDPVEPEQLVNGALKGMTRTLDPYSQYLDAKAFANLRTTTQGQFGGIGVVVSVRDNYPTVISPIEGSPASLAGMRSGDQIVKIDGKSAAGLSIDDAADRLRGPEGTQVTVTVRREGEQEERDVTLERKIIVTHSVPYSFMVGKDVGYVRLSSFAENSGAEVRGALERLRRDGAKSAVLDLRQDPGGLLEQAVDVAGQFLPKGTAGGADPRPHARAGPALLHHRRRRREELAAGAARRPGQRLRVGDRGGRAAGSRSRPAHRAHHLRQGPGAECVPAARHRGGAQAHDRALLHAERALDQPRGPRHAVAGRGG